MLYKLVVIFLAAAHALPAAYKNHAKSAGRLHALEKELDALKHVAEPRMERRTCIEECVDDLEHNWLQTLIDIMAKTMMRDEVRTGTIVAHDLIDCEKLCA